MKLCADCGKENEDRAAFCAECGNDAFKPTSVSPVEQQAAQSERADIRWREILTDPVRLFRALVVISTVTYVICFFHLLLLDSLFSQDTWKALSWQGYGALLQMPTAFGWLFLPLYVAVAVGLWMFSKSARMVFAALSAFWVVTSLLGGVGVNTAFGNFLCLLTNMADGAILVMAYTSPLKMRFG